MRWMLDDRYRRLLLPVLALTLVGFGVHFGHMVDRLSLSYDEAREMPGAHRGQDVLATFCYVLRVEDDHFFIRHYRREVAVVGRLPGLAPGKIVSVRGRILPDLRLAMEEGYVHQGRRLKWALGVSTLLVVLLLLAREISSARELWAKHV